jgi:kynurenine 3-monooxygenase
MKKTTFVLLFILKNNFMQKKKILVVGGGLVGSLWAVFLAKRGHEVSVFERRGDMRAQGYQGGRSINLAMSNRGWRAIEKAGIAEQIKSVAIPMTGRMMHSANNELTYQAYGKEGQAIYSVSRGGLNKTLLEVADNQENINFYFHQKCLGINTENSEITFENELNKEKKTYQFDYIFGTDGAYSAIRNSLQKLPRFNFSQSYLDYGYKELNIEPEQSRAFKMDKNCLHIWPRGRFMMIALPNPDDSFTCTMFMPFEGENSFEKLTDEKSLTSFFDQYFPDAAAMIPTLVEEFFNNPTPTLVTIKCNPWHHKNIVLLGDAAHAIVPFYGQGMNAGFEDCIILDALLTDYQGDFDKSIEVFSNTRPKDADAIADLALRNFIEMRDLVADPMFLLRQKIAAQLSQKYPQDFIPLYSQVTFSETPYSEALRQGILQDQLFEKILKLENIAENWQENPEIEVIFKDWLQKNAVA